MYSNDQFKELDEQSEPLKKVRPESLISTWIFRGILILVAATALFFTRGIVTKEDFNREVTARSAEMAVLQKSVSEMSSKLDITVYKINLLDDIEKRLREVERESYKKKGAP